MNNWWKGINNNLRLPLKNHNIINSVNYCAFAIVIHPDLTKRMEILKKLYLIVAFFQQLRYNILTNWGICSQGHILEGTGAIQFPFIFTKSVPFSALPALAVENGTLYLFFYLQFTVCQRFLRSHWGTPGHSGRPFSRPHRGYWAVPPRSGAFSAPSGEGWNRWTPYRQGASALRPAACAGHRGPPAASRPLRWGYPHRHGGGRPRLFDIFLN